MADLLPSSPDTAAAEDREPRVVGLDSDAADDLLSALSSSTARNVLAALHDEPATPSTIADEIDSSLQNTQYHLEKLEDAEIIEVVDTVYSSKGREMKVYAPADGPLVVFAGREEETGGLREALSRLLGGLALVAAASLAVEALFGRGGYFEGGEGQVADRDGGDPAAAPAGTPEPEPSDALVGTPGETAIPPETATPTDAATAVDTASATATPVPTPTPEPATARAGTETAAAAGTSLPPGLLFFAGGVTVLLAVAVYWYLQSS